MRQEDVMTRTSRLSTEEKLAQHVPPERVADIAYCYYVLRTNGVDTHQSEDIVLAQRVVDRFKKIIETVP